MKYTLSIYSYSGVIMEELGFNAIKKAVEFARKYKSLSGYGWALYDGNCALLREGNY